MAIVNGTNSNDTINLAFISLGVSGFPTALSDTISGLAGDDSISSGGGGDDIINGGGRS